MQLVLQKIGSIEQSLSWNKLKAKVSNEKLV
jgi:hypothetical protein